MPGRVASSGRVTAGTCLTILLACTRAPVGQPEAAPGPVAASAPIVVAGGPADTVALQDVLTEGRRIYHGQGLCYGCHGGRLQGGPVAPALVGPTRDPQDSSFAYILHVIRAGAPHTPMVNNQGGIDAGQVVQVANYVWAVSNGRSVP